MTPTVATSVFATPTTDIAKKTYTCHTSRRCHTDSERLYTCSPDVDTGFLIKRREASGEKYVTLLASRRQRNISNAAEMRFRMPYARKLMPAVATTVVTKLTNSEGSEFYRRDAVRSITTSQAHSSAT